MPVDLEDKKRGVRGLHLRKLSRQQGEQSEMKWSSEGIEDGPVANSTNRPPRRRPVDSYGRPEHLFRRHAERADFLPLNVHFVLKIGLIFLKTTGRNSVAT